MAERRGASRGRIELAIVTTAKYFVPMLLVRFRKKFPKIEIGLRVHNREAILQLLARNEVDLIMMGRVPDEIECIAAPFATNPLGIVSAPDHPLSCRRNIDLRMLKEQQFVVREIGSGTRLAMERVFAKHRIKPRIIMEMPSNETIKQAVDAAWDYVEAVESIDDLRYERKKAKVKAALEGISDDEAFAEISVRSGHVPRRRRVGACLSR